MNHFVLQYRFLFTKRIQGICYFLIIITWMILIVQSGLVESGLSMSIDQDNLILTYLFFGFNLIKIVSILFSMLLSIYSFYLNKYDVFLSVRMSSYKVICSKIIVILFIELLFTLFLVLGFSIVWVLLDTSITIQMVLQIFGSVLLLVSYYTLFHSFLLVLFDNIFTVVIPFIGYLVSNLSLDYGIIISEMSTTSQFLNLIFPDLLLIDKIPNFAYGWLFIVVIIVVVLVTIIKLFVTNDIKI